ncbi:NADPH-dependent FMN reductase [Brevibacterium renqingii]|uniref:NADPH-dependent FMN reductase n=1 Tax=Brevibacterium renqingii TaxID=2776916 RepID=UPI00345A2125
MSHTRPRISIIVGSTRTVRIGRQLADSIAAVMSEAVDADVRILDLRELALPLLDEPRMAALHDYEHAHTLAWAEEILASDGLVFLTPQYNSGYPAGLKNAIDYLFVEWKDRPATIVSYGGHGGAQAAAQLDQILRFVGMEVTDEQPQLLIAPDDYAPSGSLSRPAEVVARSREELESAARALAAVIGAPTH